MKIPKYIEDAIRKRENAAYSFSHNDYIISRFIYEHRIELDPADYGGGCESICNPSDSSERVRQAIERS